MNESKVELILGDCLEVMKGMPDKSVDAVITDPPYGIADVWVGGESANHGWSNAGRQKTKRNRWDKKPASIVFVEMLRVSKNAIIWGGNYFELPTSRGWLIWNKPERYQRP